MLNQEDLAAVLPEVNGSTNGPGEFEFADNASGRRKPSLLLGNKKTALSESSSDSEMLPKQDQIVRDAINSIHVDSDVSNDSGDSSSKQDSSEDSSSSDDEDEKLEEKVITVIFVFLELVQSFRPIGILERDVPSHIILLYICIGQSMNQLRYVVLLLLSYCLSLTFSPIHQ